MKPLKHLVVPLALTVLLWLLAALLLPHRMMPGAVLLTIPALAITAGAARGLGVPLIPSLVCLLSRVGLGLFLGIRNPLPDIYVLDENTYRLSLEAMNLDPSLVQDQGIPLFPKICWKIGALIGNPPLGEKIITALAATLAMVLIWAFLKRVFQTLPAWSFWFLALDPSLLFWSSMHLKDPWLLLPAGAVMLLVSLSTGRRGWQGLLPLCAAVLPLAMMYPVRNYWCAALASALGAGFLAWCLEAPGDSVEKKGSFDWISLSHRLAIPVSLLICLCLGLLVMTRKLSPQTFSRIHNSMCHYSQTPINPELEFKSWKDLFLYLPQGAAQFLFSPFPWQEPRSSFHLVSQVQSGLYMLLIPPGLLALLFRAFRKWDPGVTALVALMGSLLFMHGFMEGNVGTAIRHRIIILAFILPLVSVPINQFLFCRSEGRSQ